MEAQQWELRGQWERWEEVGQGGPRREPGKVEEEGRKEEVERLKEGKQAGLVEGWVREEVRAE